MATFSDLIDIANNMTHQRKVEYYVIKAAVDVMAELATTDSHAERVAYANDVLSGIWPIGEYGIAVATNSTISDKILADANYDSDLAFVVNSLFNAFAGIST